MRKSKKNSLIIPIVTLMVAIVVISSVFKKKELSVIFPDISKEIKLEKSIEKLYRELDGGAPDYTVFRFSMIAYYNLGKKAFKNNNIGIVDYSMDSSNKRFFLIDLAQKKIIFNTLVAHSRNSGRKKVEIFSNIPGSGNTSPGVYFTAETYYGRHGFSRRLDGQEEQFNSNARKRAIVLHGADYANKSYMTKKGVLGWSGGCPALPSEISDKVIRIIGQGALLFLYVENSEYLFKSALLNPETAVSRKQ